jgi:hypothetical protein
MTSTSNRDYVLLQNGDILPYIKNKDYGQFVLRVWTAEKDFIRPMTKEERRRGIEKGLRSNER